MLRVAIESLGEIRKRKKEDSPRSSEITAPSGLPKEEWEVRPQSTGICRCQTRRRKIGARTSEKRTGIKNQRTR